MCGIRRHIQKDCTMTGMTIRTVFEDGYSWVEIPDELWTTRQYNTYYNGMDVT